MGLGLGLVFPKTKLSRGRIGSTPCRVGWGLGRGLGLDAFKKSSGSGWVDSVSSWVGSGSGSVSSFSKMGRKSKNRREKKCNLFV